MADDSTATTTLSHGATGLEGAGPASLAQVLANEEERTAQGDVQRYHPLPTGFNPLDDILNGGLRLGDLMVVGGPQGVGKTIFGLQLARNVVVAEPKSAALYICYEHDRSHLMMRLLCLESAAHGLGEHALTLRRLHEVAYDQTHSGGVLSRLRRVPRYSGMLDAMAGYSNRLILAKASGEYTNLDQIGQWVREVALGGYERILLVVDYLQKIPPLRAALEGELDVTTHLTQGLKEMALSMGLQIVAIAASDRPGLQAARVKFSDLRGSSALQYEADVGLSFNNKYAIVSREHVVYNPVQAQGMRNWVVVTVEKNRAGRAGVDMEYPLDAVHFRFVPNGNMVRERLVEERNGDR